MIRMWIRSIRIQAAATLLLPLLFGGCFFNLSKKEDFRSWYYGDPGLAGALGEADCDRYADNIQGQRHPYYLHFRTPEVFLQPQGGAHYPERMTAERRASRSDPAPAACENVTRGWETFNFDAVDAGVVDAVIPYRKSSSVNDYDTGFGRQSLAYAKGVVYNTGMAAVMKAPVYIVHDILKTLYIPMAGVYYLLKPDKPSETPAESDDLQEPSSPDILCPDGGGESQNSVGNAVQEQVYLVLPQTEMGGGLEVGADATSPITVETEEEEEFATTQDASTPEAAAGENHKEELSVEGAAAPPPAVGDLPVDGEAGVPDRGEGTADAAVPENRTETPVVGDQETIPSAKAESETDLSAHEDTAVADDILKAPLSEGEVIDGAPDPSGKVPAMPADASPTPVVSVSPARKAPAAETSPSLEPIPWARLAKRKLRKKAAFIGFFSRAVNVDENTKAYLRDRLWPVFKEQCEDNLTLVRQGDPDYPAALNALMRDPYGHLNSFELTTVARFNGLNAIISGTIIDIRISRELSGILWYKSAEGQLRITILAEVYDAETGTKLLDRIYIHEEEVEELEPGSGDKPRGEDQPVLDEALQSIAEDMGEDICEALEDQPWRFFVAGIDGNRITLSAGESAGLKAGNILGVYNSQIIDGLNNQQFFLTGEKIGRIQIITLSGGRSEALLIEGHGLRDYSVAMPE